MQCPTKKIMLLKDDWEISNESSSNSAPPSDEEQYEDKNGAK